MSKMNSRSIKHLLDSVKSNTSMIDLLKKITALVDYVKIKCKYWKMALKIYANMMSPVIWYLKFFSVSQLDSIHLC